MEILWEKMEAGIIYPMIFPEVQNGKGPVCENIRKILEDPFLEWWRLDYRGTVRIAPSIIIVWIPKYPRLWQKVKQK